VSAGLVVTANDSAAGGTTSGSLSGSEYVIDGGTIPTIDLFGALEAVIQGRQFVSRR